jgi:cellulose biosynthesis protein BcsQ
LGTAGSGKTSLAIDLAYALSKGGNSGALFPRSVQRNVRTAGYQDLKAAEHRGRFQATVNLKQTVLKVDGLLFVLAARTIPMP